VPGLGVGISGIRRELFYYTGNGDPGPDFFFFFPVPQSR
jgi:hypothetical protein